MKLTEQAYTGEKRLNTDGVEHWVIDPTKLDFNGQNVTFGKKTRPILVKIAKPGEVFHARPSGHDETVAYIAKGGETVFIETLHNGFEDAFVPRDDEGNDIGQATLDADYALIGGDISGDGATYKPIGKVVPLLHEATDRPSCLKDSYGEGKHAFFSEGATFKLNHGKISGIDKTTFDHTWSLTDKLGRNPIKQGQGRG